MMCVGEKVRPRQDLERPRRLDSKLAADLKCVVDAADEGQGRGGVAAKYDQIGVRAEPRGQASLDRTPPR